MTGGANPGLNDEPRGRLGKLETDESVVIKRSGVLRKSTDAEGGWLIENRYTPSDGEDIAKTALTMGYQKDEIVNYLIIIPPKPTPTKSQ